MPSASGASKVRTTDSPIPGSSPCVLIPFSRLSQRTNRCSHRRRRQPRRRDSIASEYLACYLFANLARRDCSPPPARTGSSRLARTSTRPGTSSSAPSAAPAGGPQRRSSARASASPSSSSCSRSPSSTAATACRLARSPRRPGSRSRPRPGCSTGSSAKGWSSARPSTEDRRSVSVKLTARGRRLLNRKRAARRREAAGRLRVARPRRARARPGAAPQARDRDRRPCAQSDRRQA